MLDNPKKSRKSQDILQNLGNARKSKKNYQSLEIGTHFYEIGILNTSKRDPVLQDTLKCEDTMILPQVTSRTLRA